MASTIKNMLDGINEDGPQDIFPLMGDLAFQVVAKSLFSSLDTTKPMNDLKKITSDNQKMLIREMRQSYLKWWFKASGKIKKHLKYSTEARAILNTVIDDRIARGKNEDDLLKMLLEATYEDGTKMPREQLLDEILILFTAGHETTANALAFTLYFIAKDELLQNAMYEEITAANIGEYTIETFQKLQLVASSVKRGNAHISSCIFHRQRST